MTTQVDVPTLGSLEGELRNGPASRKHFVLRRLGRSPSALVGGLVVTLFLLIGIIAPIYTPRDPLDQDLSNSLQGPSLQHVFGTDEFGRDLLSRVMAGTTTTLEIATFGVAIGLIFGLVIGILSAYVAGWVDMILMRLIEIQMAIPGIILAIAIISVAGVGVRNLTIAVGIFSIPGFARITRVAVASTTSADYIEAAQSIGASHLRIIIRHVMPNSLAPIIVQASLRTATAILVAASLSFLGLGAQPPSPEWGAMLSASRDFLQSNPHVAVFPGLAVALVVLGFNLLGDGLRDALDTRLRV